MELFELAAADPAVRFSPNCWRTRLALDHKQLPYDTIAWHFTEKDRIARSGQGKVPVLVDGDAVIHDSWVIACHLEDRHPDRPSLFGPGSGRALARFVNQWVSEVVHPALSRVLVPDIAELVAACDRDYFRSSREAALGTSLDALRSQRDAAIATLRAVLQPLRSTLQGQTFVSGSTPLYADIVAFAAFQWARICLCSDAALLAADDPLRAWLRRMDDAFPQAAQAPGVRERF